MANGAREIFLAAVRGESTPRPAVASVCQSATYEQMKLVGAKWPEANSDAKLMARLALGAYSILGFDAVRAPFCQTIQQEALGCKIMPGDDMNLPSIIGHPYDVNQDQKPELPEDFLKRGRVPVLIEAVKIMKQEVGDKVAVIGGIIGPFSVAAELIGITECLMACMKNPSKLGPFLEVATRTGVQLAAALVDAGADVICIEDMMASVSMISPTMYRAIALPWQVEQISAINAPTILHICGKVDMIFRDMITTGATAISLEPKSDFAAAKQVLETAGKKMGMIGGIDCMDHLFYGDLTSANKAALHAKEEGYSILSPGCSVPPATKTENLKAMVEAARSN
jgi:[methyl-Co(III) methanol-specific corrinoid protein]:coenzyme M methyltransferase